jgi:hypothetical protein
LQLFKTSFKLINIFIDCVYDSGVKIPSGVGTSWNSFGNAVKPR